MFRPGLVGSDKGEVYLCFHHGGQFVFCPFRTLLKPLEGHAVLAQINSGLLLELGDQEIDYAVVDIFTTQMGVAVSRLHLKHAIADLKDRDIEGTSSEVEHRHLLFLLPVKTVRQCRGSGLVDDPLYIKASNLTCILRGLPLRVVEVCRHGDHGLIDFFTQICLGVHLEFLQDHGRDLGWGILSVFDLNRGITIIRLDDLEGHYLDILLDFFVFKFPSDKALDCMHRLFGIGNGLPPGNLPYKPLSTCCERNHRWGRPRAFGIGDDLRFTGFHNSHTGIGGTQINS